MLLQSNGMLTGQFQSSYYEMGLTLVGDIFLQENIDKLQNMIFMCFISITLVIRHVLSILRSYLNIAKQ